MEQRRKLSRSFLRHPGFLVTLCLTLLTTLAFQFGAFAAVTPDNVISYQGRLLDANGVPVTASSATMIFRLYDSLAGGSCLWSNSSDTCASATGRTVTLTDGLFSENLGDSGAGDPYALIADTVFGEDASVYLDVTVNGELLTPRKLLTAAPYALNAQMLDGLNSSSFLNVLGNTLEMGQGFTIDASSADHTAVGQGVLSIDYRAAGNGMNLGFELNATSTGLGAGEGMIGSYVSVTPNIGDNASASIDGSVASNLWAGDTDVSVNLFTALATPTAGAYSSSYAGSGNLYGFNANLQTAPVSAGTGGVWGAYLDVGNYGANYVSTLTGLQVEITDLVSTSSSAYGAVIRNADAGNVQGDAGIWIRGPWNQGVVIGDGSHTIDAGLALSGTTDDIITGTNEDLRISPTGTGDLIFALDADTNARFTMPVMPQVDMVSISNNTVPSQTDGVDGLAIIFGSNNADGEALHLTPSFTGDGSDTFNVIGIDAFSSVATAGTIVVNGLNIGALTQGGVGVSTATALNVANGWDTGLSLGDGGGSIATGILLNGVTVDLTAASGEDLTIQPGSTGVGNLIFNLPNLGDLQVQDNGTPFFTFTDGGLTTQVLTAADTTSAHTSTITSSGLGADEILAGTQVDLNASASDNAAAQMAGHYVHFTDGGSNVSQNGLFVIGTNDLFGGAPLTQDGQYKGMLAYLEVAPDSDGQGRVIGSEILLENTGAKYADELWGVSVSIADLVSANSSVYGFRADNQDVAVDGDAGVSIHGRWQYGVDLTNATIAGAALMTGSATVDLQAASGQDLDISGNGSGNVIVNLPSTGDLLVKDNGVIFATFSDAGNVQFENHLAVGGNFTPVDAASGFIERTTTVVDDGGSGDAGVSTSIAVPADDLPVIAYADSVSQELYVAKCNDAACVGTNESIVSVSANGAAGVDMAIATAGTYAGFPVISFGNNNDELVFVECTNADCSSTNAERVLDTGLMGGTLYTSIAIGNDGFPIVSVNDPVTGHLKVTHCNDASCTGGDETTSTVDDGDGSLDNVGEYSSIAIGTDVNHYPVISYYNFDSNSLRVAKCNDLACAGADETISTVDTGFVGKYTSIAIGADTFPVISYYEYSLGTLKVAKCDDVACTGANETVTVIDSAAFDEGLYTSIAVGSDTFPVVSYYDAFDASLEVAKCNDTACAGQDETITVIDTTGTAGFHTSIAIDGDGFPVISYQRTDGIDVMKVANCVDAACAITSSYTTGSDIGSASTFFKNVYATHYYGKTLTITSFDVAEAYMADDPSVESGDLVSTVGGTTVTKSAGTYDGRLLGVVSEQPGLYLSDWEYEPLARPVALTGRVPVKVNDENGPIEAGDELTSSSTPGVAMKATQPGMVVGRALEAYAGTGQGKILMFVATGYSASSAIGTDGTMSMFGDSFAFSSLGTATAVETGVNSHTLSFRGSGWNGTSAEEVGMGLKLAATDATAYRLSFTNKTDTEVAYVTGTGDLVLSGKLYPSDRGTAQTDKYIYYDGSAGPGGDFMRTNASGWSTGSYDFAEMFPSTQGLAPGELVVASPAVNEHVERSSQAYQKTLLGIVSTKPGFLAGDNKTGQFPIALKGRVPTLVNAENGPIAVGDPLTSSSTPGYAMRATKAGPVVGYALEPLNGQSGAVVAFVSLGWWEPDAVVAPVTSATSGIANTASEAPVGASTGTLSLDGGLFLAGGDILSVRRIAGLAERWSIEEDGTVKTEGAYRAIITSLQNEKVDTFATLNREQKITLSGTGRLANGLATIRFEDVDQKFNDITSTTAPVRVQVTLRGPANGVYVSQADHDGFDVREFANGTSTVDFDWYVEAYRIGQEPPTMATMPTEPPPAVPVDAAGSVSAPTPDPAPIEEAPIPEVPVEPVPVTESAELPVAIPPSPTPADPIPEATWVPVPEPTPLPAEDVPTP